MLSCELAVSPFDDLECMSDKPYHITAISVTYLVKRDSKVFQLKVKNLTKEEQKLYLKKKREFLKKTTEEVAKKTGISLAEDKVKSVVKKELISNEDYEHIKKIETDSNPVKLSSHGKVLNIVVDNNIDTENLIELEKIKEEEHKEKDPKQHLINKIKDEITNNKEIEERDFVESPYVVLQIPKKVIIELNEAKVYLSLEGKRYFQQMVDENIFAGFKILLLNHFNNGTLREFMIKDKAKPIEEQFFKTEISKMKFFDKLTQAVVELHSSEFIHTNLSPDTIYLNDDMDPVIGNFEYIHESNSMSQLDPSFFVTEGEFIFTTNVNSLNPTTLNDLRNIKPSSGDEFVKSDVSVKSDNHPLNKSKDDGKDSPKQLEVKLTFTRSLEYLAPELILPDSSRTFYFNSKLDTYSLGAIYYFMLYERPPFEGGTRDELIRQLSTRFIVVYEGTSNNSVSIFGNSLSLVPDGRTSTYYLSLLINRELSRNFEHKLFEDIKISTDYEYTNKYGRDFFDKYSEMIFVLFMAFIIIPLTVFLASYKFKSERQNMVNGGNFNNNINANANDNANNQNPQINLNQGLAINDRHA
jgi:hypothetical protein